MLTRKLARARPWEWSECLLTLSTFPSLFFSYVYSRSFSWAWAYKRISISPRVLECELINFDRLKSLSLDSSDRRLETHSKKQLPVPWFIILAAGSLLESPLNHLSAQVLSLAVNPWLKNAKGNVGTCLYLHSSLSLGSPKIKVWPKKRDSFTIPRSWLMDIISKPWEDAQRRVWIHNQELQKPCPRSLNELPVHHSQLQKQEPKSCSTIKPWISCWRMDSCSCSRLTSGREISKGKYRVVEKSSKDIENDKDKISLLQARS